MTSPDSELRPPQKDPEDFENQPIHDRAEVHETDFKLIAQIEALEREGIHVRPIIGFRSDLPDGALLRKVHKAIHEERPIEPDL